MTDKRTWLITGAGRGMGVDIAKAALAARHNVVATGRNPDTVTMAVGEADDLLVVKLDVTSRQDAEAAVKAAVDRFGGIDVPETGGPREVRQPPLGEAGLPVPRSTPPCPPPDCPLTITHLTKRRRCCTR